MATVEHRLSGTRRSNLQSGVRWMARVYALRQHPLALVLLLLGIVGLLCVGTSLIVQALRPSDGVLLTEFTMSGLSVAIRLDPTTGLKAGDEIVAIEGHTVWEWGERAWQGSPAPDWQVGQVLVYQVRRDGQVRDVPVRLRAFPLERLPVVRFGVYALIVAGLVIGSYVLVSRPDEIVAHLFFLVALCIVLLLGLHFQTAILVTPWLFIGEGILKFTGRVLLFSAFLHLSLIFPVPKLQLQAGSIYLRLLHVVNPAISVAGGLIFGATPLRRFVLASQIATWIGLLMLACSLASIVHTYLTARQPAAQGQIRWVMWGAVVGILPYLVLTGLPEVITGQALLTIEVSAFFLIAVPVSLAIAIARYRLFDIDSLLWQTLFYALYGVLMIGVYLVLKSFIGWMMVLLTGKPGEVYVVFIAACAAVSAFWVLRKPAAHYADRLLYRKKRRSQVFLRQFNEKLTSAIRLDQLVALLGDEFPRQLGATHGELLVLSENGERLESLAGEAFVIPPRDIVALWVEQGAASILRSAPGDWVPPEALALMDHHALELAVPLRVGAQVVGLWGLGPREGRLSYTAAEVRFVETIARQAALAVENARLLRRLQADRQQLEEEVQLRTQIMGNDRNRLNAILQNMADALLVTDASERIQLTNPAFERLVRRSNRSLLGRTLLDVVPLPKLSEVIQQALAMPGMVHTATLTMVNPHLSEVNDVVMGETILEISATALVGINSVICVIRDITHEVEVDRMKSEFISTVSHELRTPMTAILGFAKLTERAFRQSIVPLLPSEDAVQRVVERIGKNLSIMVSEGETLTTLVNDILDISALDASTIVWHDQPYALVLLVQDVVERLREEADAKGLVLETELDDDLPILIVDPARIEQVLGNLISNAIKFTGRGAVTISAQRLTGGAVVHDWVVPPKGGVMVAVVDTGPGMRRQELSSIFQRFYQGGDTLNGKPSGTGLGLAISRDIIAHYGGEIWAESTLGVGSTFYFTLPLF